MANNTIPSTFSTQSATRQGTLISELNIVVPRAYKEFIDKFQFVPYVMMNELAGNTMATNNKLFYWYESKGRQMSFITSASTEPSTGAGTAVTVTLSDSDVYANSKSLPEVGMIFYNSRTGVESRVTAVDKQTLPTPSTMTIVPVIDTDDASVVEGDSLQGRGFKYVGEASDYTTTQVQTIDKFTNYATQIRIDSRFTDLNLAEAIDFEYDGQRYYKYKQLADDNKKFLLQKELMLMDSNLTNNLGYAESGSAGVIQQTEANGLHVGYSSFGAQTTFADIERQLDSQGAPAEYDWLCDVNQDIAIQNALGNDFNNGAILYAQGQEAGSDLARGFKSFQPYYRKFNFTRYLPFSDAAFYGSNPSGSLRKNFGLLIPKGTSVDAKSRNIVPRFNIRYQDILGNGQQVQIAETGGLAKVPTSAKMELTVSQVGYFGVQVMGANQYAIVKGA